jgi:streptogramin lyase
MVWVPGCGSGVFAKFNPETQEWTVYDLPNKDDQFPYALSVHPTTGDIWICGTCNDSMYRFIPSTEELIEYPMPSHVTYTREVEFDKDGAVWVCNSNWPNRHIERRRGSLLRITLDGTVFRPRRSFRPRATEAGDVDR